MKNNRQIGFGAVEMVIIVVVVAVLAGLGYVLWHNHLGQSSATSDSKSVGVSSSADGVISAADAKTLVNTFYGKYYAAVLNGETSNSTNFNPNQGLMKELVNEYGTANLVAAYANAKAFDPILCAQNVPNITPTAADATTNDRSVVVSVQDKYQTVRTYKATVVSQSGLKIDSISCPAP